MKAYLYCGLDDENYAYPTFELCSTKEGAELCRSTDEKEICENPDSIDVEGDRHCMNWCDPFMDRFYVSEIHEVDVNDGDFILVYYHAYNGVDFHVIKIGNYSQCQDVMIDDINSMEIIDKMDDYGDLTIIDDGNEWHVWNIIPV